MKYLTTLLLLLSFFISFSQEEKELNLEVPFTLVEKVPIYPGCNSDDSNFDLKECMSQKISEHVAKNFNLDITSTLNLPEGFVRILVFFKIDKDGSIIEVQSKAPHPKLEKEAIRVVKLIPQMESPGRVEEEAVVVPYSLPIVFKIENKKLSKKELRKLKKQKKASN